MRRRQFAELVGLAPGLLVPGAARARQKAPARAAEPDTPAAEPSWQRRRPSQIPVQTEEFEALARAVLPGDVFDYLSTGSEDEVTLRDNVAAFRRIRVLPPLLRGVERADLSTTVLKQPIRLPILMAPMGSQLLFHPNGEPEAARGVARAGSIYCVATGADVDAVAAASRGPLWFQLYAQRDQAINRRLVEKCRKLGYKAIIVTVDRGNRSYRGLRNRFTLSRDLMLWHLKNMGYENLPVQASAEELGAFAGSLFDRSIRWDFLEWLKSVTDLPVLIKGVLSAEDARKAVSLGLDGIVVSNHGGRALDGIPATIDVLADVVAAVDGRAEVLLDGGVRRGTDVLKALALGARAVLVGRPCAWGLAADGEKGVLRVFEILRAELENAMITMGCATVGEIGRSLLAPQRRP